MPGSKRDSQRGPNTINIGGRQWTEKEIHQELDRLARESQKEVAELQKKTEKLTTNLTQTHTDLTAIQLAIAPDRPAIFNTTLQRLEDLIRMQRVAETDPARTPRLSVVEAAHQVVHEVRASYQECIRWIEQNRTEAKALLQELKRLDPEKQLNQYIETLTKLEYMLKAQSALVNKLREMKDPTASSSATAAAAAVPLPVSYGSSSMALSSSSSSSHYAAPQLDAAATAEPVAAAAAAGGLASSAPSVASNPRASVRLSVPEAQELNDLFQTRVTAEEQSTGTSVDGNRRAYLLEVAKAEILARRGGSLSSPSSPTVPSSAAAGPTAAGSAAGSHYGPVPPTATAAGPAAAPIDPAYGSMVVDPASALQTRPSWTHAARAPVRQSPAPDTPYGPLPRNGERLQDGDANHAEAGAGANGPRGPGRG